MSFFPNSGGDFNYNTNNQSNDPFGKVFGQVQHTQMQNLNVSMKIKHQNKVKKVAKIPNRLSDLDGIIQKKYPQFWDGKPTYHLCYMDEENEQIDVSDDEDYDVFKDFARMKFGGNVKLFLKGREEENKFNPEIDDCQTIWESMVLEDDNTFGLMRSRLQEVGMTGPSSTQLLESIWSRLERIEKQANDTTNQKEQSSKKKTKVKKSVKKSPKKKSVKGKKAKKAAVKKPEKRKCSNKKYASDEECSNSSQEEEKEVKLEKEEVESENTVPVTTHNDIELEADVDQIYTERDMLISLENQHKESVQPHPITMEIPKVQNLDENKEKLENESKEMKDNPHIDLQSPLKNVIIKTPELGETNIDDLVQVTTQIEEVCQVMHQPKLTTLCKNCGLDLESEIKLICSLCEDFILCEACEIKGDHDHVFIKVPAKVRFNPEIYNKFCQKMLGICIAQDEEEDDVQHAIMNPEKSREVIRTKNMCAKKATIMKKEDFKNGFPVSRGELVSLKWTVKNLTNQQWSDDVIIVCADSSDISINEQRVDLQLKGSEKGNLQVKFIMPKDTDGLDDVELNLYLFDGKVGKPMGEELKVMLRIYK